MSWQPIATAPSAAGSLVLVLVRGDIYMAEYCQRRGWTIHVDGEGIEPSHWMHHPEIPDELA